MNHLMRQTRLTTHAHALCFALLITLSASAQPVLITSPATIQPQSTSITPSAGGTPVNLQTALITVRGTTLTVNGRHTIASLALENSATLTHTANTTFDYAGNGSDIVNGMALTVTGDIQIQSLSKIDLSGKGFPGGTGPGVGTLGGGPCGGAGSGHGGAGAHGNCADRPGGITYGSATQPTLFGSGGAGYPGVGTGGNGGGAVRLIVNGTLSLFGSIAADGGSLLNGAGGAGGSIWISAADIIGSGLISARGGAEGTTNASGGGGGGGRIAITPGACGLSSAISLNVNGGNGPPNQIGSPGSIFLTMSTTPSATSQPVSIETCPSQTVTFSTQGTGTPPLTYLWRHNTLPIDTISNPSAATPTLTLNNVQPGDAGSYDCIISNVCGIAPSNPATLTVCIADFNCDSSLDFFDYLDFVAALSDNLPSADFNADAVVDFFDYLDFVQAFSSGC